MIALTLSCTVVLRRGLDHNATLASIAAHRRRVGGGAGDAATDPFPNPTATRRRIRPRCATPRRVGRRSALRWQRGPSSARPHRYNIYGFTEVALAGIAGPGAFEGCIGGGVKDSLDGLVSIGDVGHFDDDGRLLVDGNDDMVISGGENV